MGLYSFMEKKLKNLKPYDISILKLSVFAFALWLAKIWSPILDLPTWVYFVVWVVAWIYLWIKMFK